MLCEGRMSCRAAFSLFQAVRFLQLGVDEAAQTALKHGTMPIHRFPGASAHVLVVVDGAKLRAAMLRTWTSNFQRLAGATSLPVNAPSSWHFAVRQHRSPRRSGHSDHLRFEGVAAVSNYAPGLRCTLCLQAFVSLVEIRARDVILNPAEMRSCLSGLHQLCRVAGLETFRAKIILLSGPEVLGLAEKHYPCALRKVRMEARYALELLFSCPAENCRLQAIVLNAPSVFSRMVWPVVQKALECKILLSAAFKAQRYGMQFTTYA